MKCKCHHDIICKTDLENVHNLRKEYYHLYKEESFFNVKCFECECRSPVPKQEKVK